MQLLRIIRGKGRQFSGRWLCAALLLSTVPWASPVWTALPDEDPIDYESTSRPFSNDIAEIECLAVSPDGTLLASGYESGRVIVRDRTSSRMLAVWDAHHGPVLAVAFSPDGQGVATGGADGGAAVWEARTGALLARWEAHAGRVSGVGYVLEPPLVATAGFNGAVQLWRVGVDEPVATRDLESPVRSLAVDRGRQTLAVGTNDGRVTVLNEDDLQTVAAFQAHDTAARGLAFVPGTSELISGGSDGELKRWNGASGELVQSYAGTAAQGLLGGRLTALAVSPRGRTMAAAGTGGVMQLWDVASGFERETLARAGDLVTALVFTPDDATLISAGYNRSIQVWGPKLPPRPPLAILEVPESKLWSLSFAGEGTILAAGGSNGFVAVWDAATGRRTAVLEGFEPSVDCLEFSRDGRTLAAACWKDENVGLWSLDEVADARLLPAEESVRVVAFSPDGARLVAGCEGGQIRQWDTSTGELTATSSPQKQAIYALAYNRDGSQLAAGTGNWKSEAPGEVLLFEGGMLRAWRQLGTHDRAVRDLAFDPQGGFLASGSEDGELLLWDVRFGDSPIRLQNSAGTRPLAISPDGRLVATGLHDDTINVWEVETRSVVRRYSTGDDLFALEFSPDGTLLAGVSGQRQIQLWSTVDDGSGLAGVVAAWAGAGRDSSNLEEAQP